MPNKYVAHWADFVRLVLDRSPASIERIQTIDGSLTGSYRSKSVCMSDSAGTGSKRCPWPFTNFTTWEWIKRVGNLSLVSQLQLERVIGYCKKDATSKVSPCISLMKKANPQSSGELLGMPATDRDWVFAFDTASQTIIHEQQKCWADNDPEFAALVLALLPEPSLPEPGRVLTLFSPVKTRASEDWHRECEAWMKAFEDGKIRGLVGSIEDEVVYWDHYGCATLSNAKRNYLSTTRRKGEDDNDRRQVSHFVMTLFNLTGAQTRKAMYTIGRAMSIVRVPPHVELKQLKVGRSRLAVVAELYPPARLLYKSMPFVRTEPMTPAVMPIEAVNKLVGAYYSIKDPRMYVFEDIFDNNGSTMVSVFER